MQLARDLNSLGVGIAFSVVTSIALTALFETVSQLEEYVCSCVMDSLSGWSSLLGDNSFSFLLDAASSSSYSLFNSPFVTSSGLDGIFVDQGMSTFRILHFLEFLFHFLKHLYHDYYLELLSNFRPRILHMRKHFFPDAPPFEDDPNGIQTISPKYDSPRSEARIYNE